MLNITHSTGGIIALALGVKCWSLDECIKQFTSLCDEAFTPREFNNVPFFGKMAAINHGSKYKTQPLHNALKTSLGTDYLFGGKKDEHSYVVKVGVTTTEELGRKAIILANYSRSEERTLHQIHLNHEFLRPDEPHQEIQVWQAAAATAAAPSFFKPFRHTRGRTFLDGAIYNNNPVKVVQRERKLIWPDVANMQPDILLSVGTGQDEQGRRRNKKAVQGTDK